jgi:hypothetical protein
MLKCTLIGFLPMLGQHFGQDLEKGFVFVTDCAYISESSYFIYKLTLFAYLRSCLLRLMVQRTWLLWCMITKSSWKSDSLSSTAVMPTSCLFYLPYLNVFTNHLSISCFPHWLHTCVLTMLSSCTSETALENTTAEFKSLVEEPDNPKGQSPADALRHNPIKIACGIFNTIQSSQLPCVEFEDIIEVEN